jgi:hypothetical protein
VEIVNDCLKNQLITINGSCFLCAYSYSPIVALDETRFNGVLCRGISGLRMSWLGEFLLLSFAASVFSTVIVLLQ